MDDENVELDITGVYAYTDSSYSRDRELWRGFLSYVLPTILPLTPENVETEITEALVDSAEELTTHVKNHSNHKEALRCISTLLAKEIGVSPEFALASFYEGELPTKLYKFKNSPLTKKRKLVKEDNMIGNWLSNLAKIQSDKKFIHSVEKWNTWIKKEKAS